MTPVTVRTGSGRDLRVDAARNHERIVVAASRAFEDAGPAVPLEEVARRAGVGVATVYRRFRNRDLLVRAVFEHMFTTEIEPATATETDDPWHDLVTTLGATVNALANHQVVLTLAREVGAIDVDTVDRYLRSMDRLLRRAREAGLVRPELQARDLAAVVVMALATAHRGQPDRADLRRYLALLVDGLRPASTALPAPSACGIRSSGDGSPAGGVPSGGVPSGGVPPGGVPPGGVPSGGVTAAKCCGPQPEAGREHRGGQGGDRAAAVEVGPEQADEWRRHDER